LVLLLSVFSGMASAAPPAADTRQPVSMPAAARAELRSEMIDFMAALNEIIGYLGDGKLGEAARVADGRIGVGAMGKHRSSPPEAIPGRFMPDAMHGIARGMHVAASDFARVARQADRERAYAALQQVTAACVACHASYRLE
jgi:hypothetical protein